MAAVERPKGDYRDVQRRRRNLVLIMTAVFGAIILSSAISLVLFLGKKPR